MGYCRKCDGEHVEGWVVCTPCQQAGRVAVFLRVVIIHGAAQFYCATCGEFLMQTTMDQTRPVPPAYPEGMPQEDRVEFTSRK